MSWASVYWDMDYIVQAARQAMESAFALDVSSQANALQMANPTTTNWPVEKPVVENLNSLVSAAGAANVDAFATAENALSIGKPPVATPSQESKTSPSETAGDSRTMLSADTASVQVRSLWTPEIEAALREFLRPLSVSLRYEFRFPDTLDEKRSIAAMNSLFKSRPKPDDIQTRDISARNELRRKRHSIELRRSTAVDFENKKPR